MKPLLYLILFGLQCLIQCFAEETLIQMEMRFKDVPKKWLSIIEERDRKKWTAEEGIAPFPSSVCRMNTPVAYRMKAEFPLPDASEDDPAVEYGIFIDLTPQKIDQQLLLVGKVVMKSVVEGDTKGEVVRLESQEIIIRTKMEDRKPLFLLMADGGKLVITPTLLDPTGRPLGEKKD